MSVARFFYSLLWYLATPLLLLRLLWRARRQPEYLDHVAERFGFYRGVSAAGPWIWVHAVSVGETRAAAPLIRALQARYRGHHILLTHMTPTGRETGSALFGDGVLQCYLPYDQPGAVARFLERFRPVIGVLIETEVWPNLIHAAAKRRMPLYLVNARLSARSQAGYRRMGALARDALCALTGITAQTTEDAARLRELGVAEVAVTGNLKFDIEVPAEQVAAGRELRASLGARPVLLAASTRDGEEALLLDAVQRNGLGAALLVIVPRHPQRFDAVAALVAAHGLRMQRRSEDGVIAADTAVLLGDSLGEMYFYYAACDVALLGGSFLPYGAQNLIEPCALGKPVILGPSTYNFAEAAEAAVAAGAALRAADFEEALPQALQLARDVERRRAMAQAGLAFTDSYRGATQRVMECLRLPDITRSPDGAQRNPGQS
ncbi:MAG: lipid IV(A) 3-deoxy-D-manno-octulosonic acid transferase [Burkholderiales bacterium]|nr:lipid IV(A) 3-deoxy-D-manno-octulosonic acid transferase [Burkholderiales bacterium]